MSTSVAAIITTTNKRRESLFRLLDSIAVQTFSPRKIYIINDELSVSWPDNYTKYPIKIEYSNNKNNDALTCLQNRVICNVTEDCILMLNDDVLLEPSFIEQIARTMSEDENLGIVCGKILRPDKKTIDSAGQFLRKNRAPFDRGYGIIDKGQFDSPEFVFGGCGAAVLYRKKMLEDIAITSEEYFDCDYNMFYDDLDMSWRAQNYHWKAFYNPKAIAYHYRGATAKGKKPKLRLFLTYNFAWLSAQLKSDLIKNRYMTIIKNDSLGGFLKNLIFILVYDIKLWGYCLFFDPKAIIMTISKSPLIVRSWGKRRNIKGKIYADKKQS